MSPRLLRPRSTVHPEAADWARRVRENVGSVSASTLAAVGRFCRSIDAAGIRDRFYRLNLFCGDNLSAALVPLYRAESLTSTARGNATDTNNNFVSGDYNNTGASSGLKGNGSNKSLNTGLPANALQGNNQHFGVGLRAETTITVAGTDMLGVFDGSQAHIFSSRRLGGSLRASTMGAYANNNSSMGDTVANTNLAVGNLVAAWPTMYRNGVATGVDATASGNYPSAHAFIIFGSNSNGTGPATWTDVRLNWYSIGLTMTATQVAAFATAVATFNTALSRT